MEYWGTRGKKRGGFVFCYYSLCHQLIFQKLTGQQKLILNEAAVMGTLHSVEHFSGASASVGGGPGSRYLVVRRQMS